MNADGRGRPRDAIGTRGVRTDLCRTIKEFNFANRSITVTGGCRHRHTDRTDSGAARGWSRNGHTGDLINRTATAAGRTIVINGLNFRSIQYFIVNTHII